MGGISMKKKDEKEKEKVICIFDEKQEDLDTKITKIFESYLERVFNGILK